MQEHLNEVNFFWIGSKITQIEKLAFASCIANNMTPVLWTYDKIEGVADYIILKDASLILSKVKFKYYQQDLMLPIPQISDIFRYHLLNKIGGIYSDTDIVFIKNIHDIKMEEYFCSTFEYNYDTCASNCLIKLTRQSKTTIFILEELERRLKHYISKDPKNFDYCELGPFLVQKCAREMPITVLPFDVVNPISWRWTNKLIAFKKFDYKFHLKNFLRNLLKKKFECRGYFVTSDTYAVHLCNEMWKHYGISKTEKLHPKSLICQLELRYQKFLASGIS